MGKWIINNTYNMAPKTPTPTYFAAGLFNLKETNEAEVWLTKWTTPTIAVNQPSSLDSNFNGMELQLQLLKTN